MQLLHSVVVFSCLSAANYMDNWKCTGILKGDGSPLTGSSGQPTAMSTIVGSSVHASQNALNGMSAGRQVVWCICCHSPPGPKPERVRTDNLTMPHTDWD